MQQASGRHGSHSCPGDAAKGAGDQPSLCPRAELRPLVGRAQMWQRLLSTALRNDADTAPCQPLLHPWVCETFHEVPRCPAQQPACIRAGGGWPRGEGGGGRGARWPGLPRAPTPGPHYRRESPGFVTLSPPSPLPAWLHLSSRRNTLPSGRHPRPRSRRGTRTREHLRLRTRGLGWPSTHALKGIPSLCPLDSGGRQREISLGSPSPRQ